MKPNFPLLFAASALLTLTTSAPAVTQTLNPSADAFVSSNTALNALLSAQIKDSNYGAAGALAVSASGLPKGEFDSVLKFDFAAAKAAFDLSLGAGQWTVTSITLQLTAQPPNNSIFNGSGGSPANTAGNFSMKWMQNNTWTEGTGTPAAPTTTGILFSTLSSFLGGSDQSLGTFAFNGVTSGNMVYTLGLAPSLVSDVTAGNVASMLMAPADSTIAMVVNSRTGGNQPVLTVTAGPVPEPGSAVLLAGAAFALLTLRRRA
jgi:hypothetical protein